MSCFGYKFVGLKLPRNQMPYKVSCINTVINILITSYEVTGILYYYDNLYQGNMIKT